MSLHVHSAGHAVGEEAVRKGSKRMNGENSNNTAAYIPSSGHKHPIPITYYESSSGHKHPIPITYYE